MRIEIEGKYTSRHLFFLQLYVTSVIWVVTPHFSQKHCVKIQIAATPPEGDWTIVHV